MKHCLLICTTCVCTLFAASAPTRADSLSIGNDRCEVRCDPADGQFTIAAAGQKRPPFVSGKLTAGGGTGKTTTVTDKTFGDGQAIEIAHGDGSVDRIVLFRGLPFVAFRATLHNATSAPTVTKHVPLAELRLDLGTPAAELKVLGTGGLTDLGNKEVGSYMWQAVAVPRSRRGVVAGWITTDRGSGAVFAVTDGDRPKLRAQLDYGNLRLAAGASAESETFVLGLFDDARFGLEAWADAVAKVYDIHLPPQPVGYCTWYHAGSWKEGPLAEQAVFAGRELKPFGFSVVQIDDGWQDGHSKNGPRKNFTRVRSDGPYAAGMKAMADHIRAPGLVPGIWFMPFAGTWDDPWYADHQDWFVRNAEGKPYDTRWGGTCLDMTNPAVQEYVRKEVAQIAHDWGYRYFKMDGMWTGSGTPLKYVNTGYVDDQIGDATFHDPNTTNIAAYRGGIRLVREAAGKEVYLLGCCAPQNMRSYGGAFGLVDAMRVGPDNGPAWKALIKGPMFGTRHYHLHGRIWHNDPDCLYVRPQVPLNQSQLLCAWIAISGQLNISSEDYAKLPPERLDLLKRTMPSHGLPARPVDLFEQPLPQVWVVSDQRGPVRRDVVGLFNWSEAEISIERPLADLGLPADADYLAFDYWANKLVDPLHATLRLPVPPQSCRVLAVRRLAGHPQLLSTSRNITQGIVDVAEEKWDAAAHTLSGVSRVVGGDRYELRITTAERQTTWQPAAVELSDADRAAGVKFTQQPEPGLLRVTIDSPASRDVRWSVRFGDK